MADETIPFAEWCAMVQAAVQAADADEPPLPAPPLPPAGSFRLQRDEQWDALLQEMRARFQVFAEVGCAESTRARRSVAHVATTLLRVNAAARKFKLAGAGGAERFKPLTSPAASRLLSRDVQRREAAIVFQRLLGARVQRRRFRKTLKRARQRVRLLEEILSTEITYARNLQTLVDVAVAPLRWNAEHSTCKIMSQAELQGVFSNVEQLAALAQELRGKLDERLAVVTAHSRVGDVFCGLAPFFRLYSEYCNNFENARRLLTAAQQRPVWRAFWKQCQSHPDFQGMDLNAFLIMPVQRVPRYVLLLKELRKNTTLDPAEERALGHAVELVKSVAAQINLSMYREEEVVADMLRCEQFFGDHVSVLEPHRRLASHSRVRWVRSESIEPAEAFLFNDLVIMARPASHDSFEYLEHVPLTNSTHVVDVPDLHPGVFAVRVVAGRQVLTLLLESMDAKLLWLEAIEQLVAHLRRTRPSVAIEPTISVMTAVEPPCYCLTVRRGSRRRAVRKTMAEFRELHALLSHTYSDLPPLPPRALLGEGSPRRVRDRALMLGQYVQTLLLRSDLAADPDVRAFCSWPVATSEQTGRSYDLPDGEFELIFGEGRLGLRLETGFNLSCIEVKGCEPGSLAGAMPELRRSLVLTALNEAPLPKDFGRAMSVLRSTVRPFKLRFRDDSLHYRDMMYGGTYAGTDPQEQRRADSPIRISTYSHASPFRRAPPVYKQRADGVGLARCFG